MQLMLAQKCAECRPDAFQMQVPTVMALGKCHQLATVACIGRYKRQLGKFEVVFDHVRLSGQQSDNSCSKVFSFFLGGALFIPFERALGAVWRLSLCHCYKGMFWFWFGVGFRCWCWCDRHPLSGYGRSRCWLCHDLGARLLHSAYRLDYWLRQQADRNLDGLNLTYGYRNFVMYVFGGFSNDGVDSGFNFLL